MSLHPFLITRMSSFVLFLFSMHSVEETVAFFEDLLLVEILLMASRGDIYHVPLFYLRYFL